MNAYKFYILLLLVFTLTCDVSAVPPPAIATCTIKCSVAEIVEWSQESFSEIDLGQLTSQNKQAMGESALTLYTNGDVTIIADNSNKAELSLGQKTLLTEYKLKYDGSGIDQTGGRATQWSSFDTFLKEGGEIKHVPADGAVKVILSVKASIENITPENSGEYNAIQTLTVCWKS